MANPSSDGDPMPEAIRSPNPEERLTSEEFAALFKQSYRRLWLIAAGITNDRDQAEDIVQEAALTALGKLDQFEPGTNYVAWMARIVRLKSLNASRTAAKRATHPADPTAIDRSHAGRDTEHQRLERAVELAELHNLEYMVDDELSHALQELAEAPRVCLLLRTVLDMTYAEISEIMSIPEGTAMSHVHRSRHTLRERLTRDVPRGSAPTSESR